jgi:hypothetical protein
MSAGPLTQQGPSAMAHELSSFDGRLRFTHEPVELRAPMLT